jgi:hypothetical protein
VRLAGKSGRRRSASAAGGAWVCRPGAAPAGADARWAASGGGWHIDAGVEWAISGGGAEGIGDDGRGGVEGSDDRWWHGTERGTGPTGGREAATGASSAYGGGTYGGSALLC